MENNQDIIKAKAIKIKQELDGKLFDFISPDCKTKINISYAGRINSVEHCDVKIDGDLLIQINFAVEEVKKRMSEDYIKALSEIGIKI